MTQFLMAIFGLTSIYCAMGNNPALRKWAPILGLVGQPAWAYFAWQSQAWGMLVLVLAYTAVYLRGAWVQWILVRHRQEPSIHAGSGPIDGDSTTGMDPRKIVQIEGKA